MYKEKQAIYLQATSRNDTNFFPLTFSSGMSETDTSRGSLDHGWKAWCIDLGRKILGHHWLADTSFLLASLSLRGPGFIFRRGLIDRRQLCASLGGIVPPCGVRVGQTKALGKVEPMMGINGWEMSTNTALCNTEGHFRDTYFFMWTRRSDSIFQFSSLHTTNVRQLVGRKQTVVTFPSYVDSGVSLVYLCSQLAQHSSHLKVFCLIVIAVFFFFNDKLILFQPSLLWINIIIIQRNFLKKKMMRRDNYSILWRWWDILLCA